MEGENFLVWSYPYNPIQYPSKEGISSKINFLQNPPCFRRLIKGAEGSLLVPREVFGGQLRLCSWIMVRIFSDRSAHSRTGLSNIEILDVPGAQIMSKEAVLRVSEAKRPY